jgi:hypothetical protein
MAYEPSDDLVEALKVICELAPKRCDGGAGWAGELLKENSPVRSCRGRSFWFRVSASDLAYDALNLVRRGFDDLSLLLQTFDLGATWIFLRPPKAVVDYT